MKSPKPGVPENTPAPAVEPKKLTTEEFALRAIEKLRKPEYAGIHAVYSGFNQAFRRYFPDLDPVVEMKKLAEEGKIQIRPARGGATLLRPDAKIVKPDDQTEETLKKMGLAK